MLYILISEGLKAPGYPNSAPHGAVPLVLIRLCGRNVLRPYEGCKIQNSSSQVCIIALLGVGWGINFAMNFKINTQYTQLTPITHMKNQVKEFREPRIRVSRKVYIAVMEEALDEAVFLDHEEGMLLMCAVRAYLCSARNAPTSGDRIYKLFRRYRDIIDRAAERSARARAAAQRRREAREAAAADTTAMSQRVGEAVIRPSVPTQRPDISPRSLEIGNLVRMECDGARHG